MAQLVQAKVRLIGLAEAAGYLGLGVRTLQLMIARGELQVVRLPGVGRRVLLDVQDLEKLVEAGKARTLPTREALQS